MIYDWSEDTTLNFKKWPPQVHKFPKLSLFEAMKVKEQRTFASQRQFMKKPKPWKALKSKLSNTASSSFSINKPTAKNYSLKAVVRRLKCLNASSTLFRVNLPTNHQPIYLKYSEKWENRNKNKLDSFPFLQRNLELCVNKWNEYEKKFIEWSAMRQQQQKNRTYNQRNSEDVADEHVPCSSKKSQRCGVRDAEMIPEEEDNKEEKKLLKSFYTVYHIDKLHKNKKISSVEELANSEYVEASVQEAPNGGLNSRRYSAQEASALSPKTLMALERWRNAQGPVFLPEKADRNIRKKFMNDRGGSGDESGEEDLGSGLDVWNRYMAHIEHTKVSRRSQPIHQNSSDQEKGSFLPSKYTSKIEQRLSFESVQSMPDIAAGAEANTSSKGPIITEVLSADEQEEEEDDRESEDPIVEVNGRALGRQRVKHSMKIEEVFDQPKQKLSDSRQKSLGQCSSNSETNKENYNLVSLRLSSGKLNAKQHIQDNRRLSDLKTISTPDLFGRLEREIQALKNRRANRPGIRGSAKLFANNVSPLAEVGGKGGSKAQHKYSTPPAPATELKAIRRSPRFSHA